jgi:glycosyltransferase involved in cell wall biosynthesis
VRPFYRRASVLALPSLSEGSPNVLIEAMAAGLPVVATAVGGVPETLVAGREGLLVPVGDAKALADGILLQLHDRERALAMAEAAKVRVREQMNPEVRVERILSVYRDALGRNEKNIG